MRRPSRVEVRRNLREIGDGALMIMEFIGLLIFIVAAIRYVTQASTVPDSIVAALCLLAFVYRRFNPRHKGD